MFDYRDMFDDLHLVVTIEIIRYTLTYPLLHLLNQAWSCSWDITLTQIGLLKRKKKFSPING